MKLKFNISNQQRISTLSIVLILFLFVFSSCSKYLDKPQKSGQKYITTVKDCQEIINFTNLYSSYSPTDKQLCTDEYYLTDGDYDGIYYEQYRGLYRWDDSQLWLSGGTNWKFIYNNVYTTNVALESLDKIVSEKPGIKEGADFKLAKGMALFLRAFSHYQIAEMYAKAYTTATAKSDIGIPLRLTSDINEKSIRGSVKETYDKIIEDVLEAITLLPNTTIVPTQPNKAAAYALLARIYLAMEEYTLAKTAVDAALQLKNDLLDYNTIDPNVDNGFPLFNTEIIYYCEWGALDMYSTKVNQSVMASYASNDLRSKLLFKELSVGEYYFNGGYSTANYFYFYGLATDELYLIRAECYARAGNTASALTDLNALLRTRWKTGTYSNMTATSADDALAKILAERRKELMMRGERWMDLKRLNKDPRFAVTLSRTIHGVTYTLPPNSLKYQLLIPKNVIDYGGIEQNPR